MAKTISQLEAAFTQEELDLIRAQRAEYQRAFWSRMTPEERKKRKALYALHTAQRKQRKEQELTDAAAE